MSQQGSSNEGRRMYRAFFTSIEKDSNSDEMKARHNTTVVSTISSAQDAGSTTAESDVVGSRWWWLLTDTVDPQMSTTDLEAKSPQMRTLRDMITNGHQGTQTNPR